MLVFSFILRMAISSLMPYFKRYTKVLPYVLSLSFASVHYAALAVQLRAPIDFVGSQHSSSLDRFSWKWETKKNNFRIFWTAAAFVIHWTFLGQTELWSIQEGSISYLQCAAPSRTKQSAFAGFYRQCSAANYRYRELIHSILSLDFRARIE